MNTYEYAQWKQDALAALKVAGYTEKNSAKIIDWFDTISWVKEECLVGEENINTLIAVFSNNNFSMYNSLMARLWIYADLIINNED